MLLQLRTNLLITILCDLGLKTWTRNITHAFAYVRMYMISKKWTFFWTHAHRNPASSKLENKQLNNFLSLSAHVTYHNFFERAKIIEKKNLISFSYQKYNEVPAPIQITQFDDRNGFLALN